MIVVPPCPREIWDAAGPLLARQRLFARTRKKLRGHSPIPLVVLTSDGTVGDLIGWRFLLRIGRRSLSADLAPSEDGGVVIVALWSAPATARWLAALVALEEGRFGTAREIFELMIEGVPPYDFPTALLIAADRPVERISLR